jgi:hypothetical protein
MSGRRFGVAIAFGLLSITYVGDEEEHDNDGVPCTDAGTELSVHS